MLLVHSVFILMVVKLTTAHDTTSTQTTKYNKCDYYATLKPGVKQALFSPNYSNNYLPGTACRWTLVAPVGSTIFLNCIEIKLPSSQGCTTDRLVISQKGLPNLEDGSSFCGTGSLGRYSVYNQMVVALFAESRSIGGRFYCEATIEQACSCGRRQLTRIVGGQETAINEFTMMAGIWDFDVKEVACGGTIISDYYVTTAAHCVTKHISKYAIIVGNHNRTSNAEPTTGYYRIATVKTHSNYDSKTQLNDIALIRTSERIIWNIGVGPACLPFKFRSQNFAGKVVDAPGWGTLEYAGPRPDVLMKVSLNVITNSVCKNSIPSVASTQMCTYTAGKDTCQFDSGGGLYYQDTNSYLYHTGIINFGLGCASSKPSVNLRITEYLDWIKSNTPGTVYCEV